MRESWVIRSSEVKMFWSGIIQDQRIRQQRSRSLWCLHAQWWEIKVSVISSSPENRLPKWSGETSYSPEIPWKGDFFDREREIDILILSTLWKEVITISLHRRSVWVIRFLPEDFPLAIVGFFIKVLTKWKKRIRYQCKFVLQTLRVNTWDRSPLKSNPERTQCPPRKEWIFLCCKARRGINLRSPSRNGDLLEIGNSWTSQSSPETIPTDRQSGKYRIV